MAYCTSADVLALVSTNMSAADVNDIIARTDERIKLRIDVGSVNALVLEDISSLWSAYRVMLRDPNARSLGEYSERRETALQLLKKEIDELLAMANSGVSIIGAMEEVI